MSPDTALDQDFGLITDLIRGYAQERPEHPALIHDGRVLAYGELDQLMDRVAASLQRDGVQPGEVIAICAASCVEYGAIFLGALRAGSRRRAARAVIDAGSVGDDALGLRREDPVSRRSRLAQRSKAQALPAALRRVPDVDARAGSRRRMRSRGRCTSIRTRRSTSSILRARPAVPKGIVQPHRMRWAHVHRAAARGYDRTAVTICSTPLYSNTTLVSFFPALARGGTVVLMAKFDAPKFLELAQQHRATHAMLVPVQYQRIMDLPDFGRFDLSSFRMKFCTSAPFAAALKADILERWPGGLTEYYGMTEGGGTCILHAHEFPDKLHTVGQPAPGHDVRLIDEHGQRSAARRGRRESSAARRLR